MTAWFFLDQLKKIVGALPRKLIVFVTHHHRDHIGGMDLLFSGLVWWLLLFFFFLLSFEYLVHALWCMIFLCIRVSGLSAIQESNPDAILVAHVKTRNRISMFFQYCFAFLKILTSYARIPCDFR